MMKAYLYLHKQPIQFRILHFYSLKTVVLIGSTKITESVLFRFRK